MRRHRFFTASLTFAASSVASFTVKSPETTATPLGISVIRDFRDFLFASPVGAAGCIYITGRDGATVVLRHDRENATLAVNRLDDSFSASAALVDKRLYLRGERFLYCIAEK